MQVDNAGHHHNRRPQRLRAAGAVCMILVAGCGTRVNRAQILRAEAGGTATAPGLAAGSGGSALGVANTGAASSSGPQAPGSASGLAASSGTGTGHGATASGGGGSSGTGATSAGTGPNCAQAGPPVVIGQVGSFSGLVGANFGGAIQTPYVWVKYMNAHGGLGCHPIQFIQIDDGSDPAKSEAAVEDLVANRHAVAILGAFVPLDMSGFRTGAEKEHVAVIGGDQAGPEWIQSPVLFPVGGTSRPAIAGSVKQASQIGKKKIAVLSCVEASPCGSNFTDTIVRDGFAQKFGMQVVYTGSVSITQPDFTAQCQSAKNAGADTIAWGLDKAGLQRAARSCASISYFPTLPLISLQGTFDRTDPNIRTSGAFLSSPTFPYMQNDNAAEQAFHAAMQQYAPSAPLDSAASQVWSEGQMLETVVNKLGPTAQTRPLTKDDFFQGAALIKGETLGGLIPPTTWNATGPQPENPCYFGEQFTNQGALIAPHKSSYDCI
jgi:branched-chain amino acid transport system substrate-binding protein